MPDTSSENLPLDIIRLRARTHVASRGDSATNLYIRDAIYRAGEVIQPKRADIVIPRDSVMVFADDEPLRNWGHRCRYLLHDPNTGVLIDEIHALLPPTLDFGATFTAFHMPTSFPATNITYPVVSFPSGIYVDAAPQWYAILYSGASMNRHVNDLEFLYRTLVNLYAIPAANITVLSYDGTLDYNDASWQRVPPPVGNWPGDGTPYQMKINGAGTRAELLNAISAVGKKLGPNDKLLLHTNNHGNTVGGGVHHHQLPRRRYHADRPCGRHSGAAEVLRADGHDGAMLFGRVHPADPERFARELHERCNRRRCEYGVGRGAGIRSLRARLDLRDG